MSNRKTNKTKKWQKVVTVFALLAVGALVAVGIIHTKKHWNEITTAVENVVNTERTEAVEQ